MRFRFLSSLLLAAATALLAAGCASPETKKTDHEKVSTIPWNRPQSWEGKGMIGGMTGN
jgi:hypothetical protein